MGSPGSACAHFLGSLAASPRSHAKIPGPGPSFSGICTVPQPSHRHAAWKVRSTCLQSTGPVSPGATWEHGRLQQQACVVVGGTGLPCGHLGIETTCPLWYLMDGSIVTVLCCVVFYCTVLQSRTQVRREPYVGRRTIPSSCPSGRDRRHLKFRSSSCLSSDRCTSSHLVDALVRTTYSRPHVALFWTPRIASTLRTYNPQSRSVPCPERPDDGARSRTRACSSPNPRRDRAQRPPRTGRVPTSLLPFC